MRTPGSSRATAGAAPIVLPCLLHLRLHHRPGAGQHAGGRLRQTGAAGRTTDRLSQLTAGDTIGVPERAIARLKRPRRRPTPRSYP